MQSDLHVYNSLTRSKERFEPINPPSVGMYVCGPTVYSDVHLGNVRTFLTFDVIYRYLSYLGYKVRYVRNITDVGHLVGDIDEGEDKIAKKARLENLEPMEVVQRYTYGFRSVMEIFNILPPSIEPTATGHIVEQIEMIERILANGYGYEVNGSVYFDVPKFNEDFPYGELSGRKIEDLMSNSRELDGQQDKKSPLDFALWKKAEKGHLMRWNSPWGIGFPGWHLECSAMSTKYLGAQFDIHGGGMDLKFPHHECEIAQNIGSHTDEERPVRYWLHGNMLTVNGRKMSKSEGNGFTPEELITGNHKLLEQGYSPMTVRFFMLQGHYSGTLDFSNEALQAGEKGLKRLMAAMETMETLVASDSSSYDVADLKKRCAAAMNDDFNTPILISELFDAVKAINSAKDGSASFTAEDLENLKTVMGDYVYEVLGLRMETADTSSNGLSDGLMDLIIELRKQARENKDWSTSDQIRDALKALSVTLKDSKEGTAWQHEN